jgi:hypothetical protein
VGASLYDMKLRVIGKTRLPFSIGRRTKIVVSAGHKNREIFVPTPLNS